MSEPSIRDALLEELEHLPEPDRKRVLEYARSLSHEDPRGVPGSSLRRFAGVLSESDASEIEAAIEEGCEKVNSGGW